MFVSMTAASKVFFWGLIPYPSPLLAAFVLIVSNTPNRRTEERKDWLGLTVSGDVSIMVVGRYGLWDSWHPWEREGEEGALTSGTSGSRELR